MSSAIADITRVLSCLYISHENLGLISGMSFFSQWYFPLSGRGTIESLWEIFATSPFLGPSRLCRSLARSSAGCFAPLNRRACLQATVRGPKSHNFYWLIKTSGINQGSTRSLSRHRLYNFSHMALAWHDTIFPWFSHDVTKIQTKKLSILPGFYFQDALEQLKTNFHRNFRFKRVLGFVIEDAWISKLLPDAAFTWRQRELSCRFKKWLNSGNFAI